MANDFINSDNVCLFHTFSKTPINANPNSLAAGLGNAVNKSGHTVQSSDVWRDSVPFFGKAGSTILAHGSFSEQSQTNDLVRIGSDIWQRNATPYSTDAKFEDLWSKKTTSITSNVATDGVYPTTEGALVNGSYLLNKDGKPVVKYHERALLTELISDNNAFIESEGYASKLQANGVWVDQFVGVTDAYVNGSASVAYKPEIYRTSSSEAPLQAGMGKDYMEFSATGTVLWSSPCENTEVITCFEYVGSKISSIQSDLDVIFEQLGMGGTTGGSSIGARLDTVESTVSGHTTSINNLTTIVGDATDGLVKNVADNATAIEALEGLVGETSVAEQIETAIGGIDVGVTSISISDKGDGYDVVEQTNDDNGAVTVTIDTSAIKAAIDGIVANVGTTSVADQISTEINALKNNEIKEAQETADAAVEAAETNATNIETLQGAVGDANSGLVKDVATNASAIKTLQETVGDENGGLVKSVADNTSAIGALQSTISSQLVYKVVASLEAAQAEMKVNTIYLVPNTGAEAGTYIEYLCYNDGTSEEPVLKLEQIGSTKTDLSEYAKTSAITGSVTVTNATDVSISLADGKLSGSITADTAVTQNSSKLVTSDAVYSAIEALSAENGAIHTLSTTVSGLSSTVEANKTAAETGINDAKAAAKAAQDDVDALETLVGSLPEGTTGSIVNYIVTEIDKVETALDTRVEALESIDHTTYATKTDLDGVDEKAKAAQTSAAKRLTTIFKINPSDERFTIGTAEPNIVDGTQDGMKIGISLAENVATTNIYEIGEDGNPVKDAEGNPVVTVQGTVYTKDEVQSYISDVLDDFAGEGSMKGGYVKTINEMTCETTGSNVSIVGQSNYFGSEIVTKDTANRKLIINKSQSWSVGNTKLPSSITSVTNGVANDGIIIDTENLTDGVSMFSGNTALTTVCSDFGKMTSAVSMFSGCSALTSFCGDLSSLTNGEGMFNGCENLSSFCGDLSSLTNGEGMFAGCADLTTDSIDLIIDVLPTYNDSSEHVITISNASADQITAGSKKGWTVTTTTTA